jgi:hypothetical protein
MEHLVVARDVRFCLWFGHFSNNNNNSNNNIMGLIIINIEVKDKVISVLN